MGIQVEAAWARAIWRSDLRRISDGTGRACSDPVSPTLTIPVAQRVTHPMSANPILLIVCSCIPWLAGAPVAADVTVFAAASLGSALQEILPAAGPPAVSLSFGSSSALARQIEAGAPAGLFVSASEPWMDYLQERGLVDAATRVDLLANRLVVVAPAGEGFAVEVRPGFDFAGAFAGRLALGDPDHVPAGVYARQALERLGWWAAVRDRLASAPDVRAALVFVARGECSAGIVYATDAAVSDRVEVVATFPDSLHAPIRYPAAAVMGRATPAVRQVLARLRTPAAAAVFRRQGFAVLATADSAAPGD